MTKKLRARQAALEKQGQFATDMNEKHRTFDALDIDKGYEYLPRRPLERVRRAVVLSVVAAAGPLRWSPGLRRACASWARRTCARCAAGRSLCATMCTRWIR